MKANPNLWLLLATVTLPLPASAVVPVFDAPPALKQQPQQNREYAATLQGSGTITSINSNLIRIDSRIFMLTATTTVKAAQYPYRTIPLSKGMQVSYHAVQDSEDGIAILTSISVNSQ